jgi:hypothetical protein
MSFVAPRARVTLYPSHPKYVCGDGQAFFLGLYCEPTPGGAAGGGGGGGGRSFFDLVPAVEYTLRCGATVAIDPTSPAGRQHHSISAAIDSFNATQDVLAMRTAPSTPSGGAAPGLVGAARGGFSPIGGGGLRPSGGWGGGVGPLPLPPLLATDSLSYRVAGMLRDVDVVDVYTPSSLSPAATASTATYGSLQAGGPGLWGPGGLGGASVSTGRGAHKGQPSHSKSQPWLKASVPSPVSYTLGAPPPWASPTSAASSCGSVGGLGAGSGAASLGSPAPAGVSSSGVGGRRRRGRKGRGKRGKEVPQQARDLVRSLVQLAGETVKGSASTSEPTCSLPPVAAAGHPR